MPTLQKNRLIAFIKQNHRCYYCNFPMWLRHQSELLLLIDIKTNLARLQCTAEHLVPRQDGGTNAASNIVAACRFCNQGRHRQLRLLTPQRYRDFVRGRIRKGKWHPSNFRLILGHKTGYHFQ